MRSCIPSAKLHIQFVSPLYLALLGAFRILSRDGTSLVAGVCAFSMLLFLPINTSEVIQWNTVNALNFKAFMANSDIQPISLIGPVLYQCPLFTPDGDVFSVIMFPVFFLAETVRTNSPRWNDNVNVGVVSGWVSFIPSLMDCGYRT